MLDKALKHSDKMKNRKETKKNERNKYIVHDGLKWDNSINMQCDEMVKKKLLVVNLSCT